MPTPLPRLSAPALLVLTAIGCAASPEVRPVTTSTATGSAELRPAPENARTVGRSVEGRAIDAYTLGDGPDRVLILATIHGDENAGAKLAWRLMAELSADPGRLGGRTVVVVPVVNPDGLAADARYNARGVDLNRNFPASTRIEGTKKYGPSPLSEPESRAVFDLIESRRPNRIVTVHQPLRCVDYDGPAADLAALMSQASGLPVKKLGALPGSFGSHVGLDLGIPTVTYELPRDADALSADALWNRYGPALLAAVAFEPAETATLSPVTSQTSKAVKPSGG